MERFDHQLNDIDRELGAVRVEFERYFNGGVDIPPTDQLEALSGQLRQLRSKNLSVADSFRLGALESRYNSYREMLTRRLRDSELGRQPDAGRPTSTPIPIDVEAGVVVRGAIPGDAAAELHRHLYGGGSSRRGVDLADFKHFLEQQTERLRDRTGCSGVRFRLIEQDGELRLKAKPVHTKS